MSINSLAPSNGLCDVNYECNSCFVFQEKLFFLLRILKNVRAKVVQFNMHPWALIYKILHYELQKLFNS